MKESKVPLPDFDAPPLIEVALSAQFEPLANLLTPHFGLYWDTVRQRFPRTEEKNTLDPAIERYGVRPRVTPAPRIQLFDKPPVSRCWFLTEHGGELLQIQQDRFIHNWRKVDEDDPYPRYDNIRKTFAEEIKCFNEFVNEIDIGTPQFNQCEVTYVNHIEPGPEWKTHADINKVFSPFSCGYSDSFLGEPEDARFSLKYVLLNKIGKENEFLGRLYIDAVPAFRLSDDVSIFILKVIARGGPIGEGVDGVMRFFDMGREHIVRAFASVTTPRMHEIWERKDGSSSFS